MSLRLHYIHQLTAEVCRVVASKADAELLLVRLGIDGFHCGKRKVFLKYYHLDFLTQVTYLHIATQYIATQYLHNVYIYPSSTRTSTRRSCGCRLRPGDTSPGSGRSGRGGTRHGGEQEQLQV